MKLALKSQLKPLYKSLLSKVESEKQLYPFCLQWGKHFPEKANEGILFIGKATNGWITPSRDVEVLFEHESARIFDRPDQMGWVENRDGNKEGYNSRRSAFWRVVKKTSKQMIGKKNVLSHVAWTNLYKVSYAKGNPGENLKRIQREHCKRILAREIEVLSPRFVVFLTSGWEKPFIDHLNGGLTPKFWKEIKWEDKYSSQAFNSKGITYITSYHPQGKKEQKHVNALIELMK